MSDANPIDLLFGGMEKLGPGSNPDKTVRDFAVETIEEIRIFGSFEESYGYVFYVLQKA